MTDLARLVVALEAQTAKYQAGLDSANRKLEKFQRDQNRRLDQINSRFSSFAGGVKGALLAIGAGYAFRAIIKATAEAEEAFTQLEDAVKQTGGTAGFTAKQLADYAGELQKITTFGDEEIQNLEQVLLRFRSIQGVNFTRTTRAVLDLATVLKIDLTAAAKLVGTAMEDPATGMSQLRRRGIVLSEQQKTLIKDLAATGHRAEAQAMLLSELEKRYQGAAEAARDNFGGALKALHNAFGDLLEGKGGVSQATNAINSLTDTLNDPAVKEGFANIVGGFIKIVEWAAKAATALNGITKFWAEEWGSKAGVASDDVVRLSDKVIWLRKELAHLQDVNANGGFIARYLEGNQRGIDAGIAARTRQLREAEAALAAAQKAAEEAFTTGAGVINIPTPAAVTQLQPGQVPDDSELDAVIVRATKSHTDAMQKLYDQWNEDTKTALDKDLDEWAEWIGKLEELQRIPIEMGGITEEQALDRIRAYNEEHLLEVEVTAKKVGNVLEKQADEYTEFLKEAARNTQNILADGLYNAMKGKFTNILDAFFDMIDQMVAQALAANLAGKLFGNEGGILGGGGGWIGKGLDFLGTIFGGSRDVGGRGRPGHAYKIGTGAQPEWFVPDTPGTFMPADMVGAMAGGRGVTQNFYYERPPTERTVGQQQRDATRGMRRAARLS